MRLLHIVHPADLRCRQDGLIAQAKENGVKTSSMKPGDIVVFLNSDKTKFMLLAMTSETDSHGVLCYYRSPHGRVPPEAMEFVPQAFGGHGGFEMNKAIRMGLEKLLHKKTKKVQE